MIELTYSIMAKVKYKVRVIGNVTSGDIKHCVYGKQHLFLQWRNLALCLWETTSFSPVEKFSIVSMGNNIFFSSGEI